MSWSDFDVGFTDDFPYSFASVFLYCFRITRLHLFVYFTGILFDLNSYVNLYGEHDDVVGLYACRCLYVQGSRSFLCVQQLNDFVNDNELRL